MNVSWECAQSYLFYNPKSNEEERKRALSVFNAAKAWPGHIWLATSGSSALKWVGISKKALLASAKSVNDHLNSDYNDRWIHVLPNHHVGGLGIGARAYLSGSQVFSLEQKWNAQVFLDSIYQYNGSLSALVPTQLYDLVQLGVRAPASLRALVIGGGVLPVNLYERAIQLGWPVMPSYGMTECGSQIATASLDCWKEPELPVLHLLKHMQAKEDKGYMVFSGSSLFSTYAFIKNDKIQFIDPKVGGWFKSNDRGSIHKNTLCICGRGDELIKIGGELVDLALLEQKMQNLRISLNVEASLTLMAVPDNRLGFVIHLVSEKTGIEKLIKAYQESVLPFERIRKTHYFDQIPKSSLGKILKKELLSSIKNDI